MCSGLAASSFSPRSRAIARASSLHRRTSRVSPRRRARRAEPLVGRPPRSAGRGARGRGASPGGGGGGGRGGAGGVRAEGGGGERARSNGAGGGRTMGES